LGFHFARAYWGHGYATESASACLAWALTNRTERILAHRPPKPLRLATRFNQARHAMGRMRPHPRTQLDRLRSSPPRPLTLLLSSGKIQDLT
jgi:hypothetical protein